MVNELYGNRARIFMLAGNATITVENPTTGNRYTYRIQEPRNKGHFRDDVRFVSVLTGQNNEGDYTFVGSIFLSTGQFRWSAKSRVGQDATSVRAFGWVWGRVFSVCNWAPVVIRHEGRCGRCGRKLTTVESIESGLGPVCAGRPN